MSQLESFRVLVVDDVRLLESTDAFSAEHFAVQGENQ